MPIAVQPLVCRVEMFMRCENGVFGLLPNAQEGTNSLLTALVYQKLLDCFDVVLTNTVGVQYSPNIHACSLHVGAECLIIFSSSYPERLLKMELALESNMGCALLELFETVSIGYISITPLSSIET